MRCALNRRQTLPAPLLGTLKTPNPFSWFPMLYFEPSHTLPTPLLRTIESSVRRGEKTNANVFPGSPKYFVNFDEIFPCYVSTKMDKSLPVRQTHKSHVMCQKKTRLNRLPSPVSSAPTLYRNIAYHSEFNGAGCCGIKMVRVLEMEIPN